jgi:hypothetical protein
MGILFSLEQALKSQHGHMKMKGRDAKSISL